MSAASWPARSSESLKTETMNPAVADRRSAASTRWMPSCMIHFDPSIQRAFLGVGADLAHGSTRLLHQPESGLRTRSSSRRRFQPSGVTAYER